MSKDNKAKRALKKREKLRIKKTRLSIKAEKEQPRPIGISTPVLENFSPFQHLTDEMRRELIDDIGAKSKISYQERLNEIQHILVKHDPITVLAIVSGYCLSVGAGDQGVQYKEREDSFNQSHVEILQALILKMPESEWGKQPPTPDVIQGTINALKYFSRDFTFSRFASERFDLNDKEKAVNEVQEWIRNHTQSVRNWGFYSQVKCISTELYSYFDEKLLNHLGFRASEVIVVFDFMVRTIEKRLTERLTVLKQLKKINNKKELVKKYHHIIGQGQK